MTYQTIDVLFQSSSQESKSSIMDEIDDLGANPDETVSVMVHMQTFTILMIRDGIDKSSATGLGCFL